MEELYRMIEETIRKTGYEEPVDGAAIYDELCDEIEDKEPGTYVFMSKTTDETIFEYAIQVYEEEFNLSSIDIHTPSKVYHADFDRSPSE